MNCATRGDPASHSSREGVVKRFIVSLPDSLAAELRAAAALRGEAIAVWLREAVREKLEREKS